MVGQLLAKGPIASTHTGNLLMIHSFLFILDQIVRSYYNSCGDSGLYEDCLHFTVSPGGVVQEMRGLTLDSRVSASLRPVTPHMRQVVLLHMLHSSREMNSSEKYTFRIGDTVRDSMSL